MPFRRPASRPEGRAPEGAGWVEAAVLYFGSENMTRKVNDAQSTGTAQGSHSSAW